MKALTLWQPWASLVALGVKTIETRSWKTDYRGPLAIHAAGKMPSYNDRYVQGVSVRQERVDLGGEWWMDVRPAPNRTLGRTSVLGDWPCPLGAVVATCTLVDVVPMIPPAPVDYNAGHVLVVHDPDLGSKDYKLHLWRCDGRLRWESEVTDQRPYGDYSPGRFAWLLADIEPLAGPVPAKGRQGLWEWTPAADATAV